MRTARQLRCLIANQRERLAWLDVMLEEFPVDALPRNFHAQCVLARQMLRSFEQELADLTLPAAALQAANAATSGRLVTSLATPQPAPVSTS